MGGAKVHLLMEEDLCFHHTYVQGVFSSSASLEDYKRKLSSIRRKDRKLRNTFRLYETVMEIDPDPKDIEEWY